MGARASRARIGITSGTSEGWDGNGFLWSPLKEAIEEAGAEAVWLGASSFLELAAYEAALNRLDGLLLAGGADIDPRHYSEEATDLADLHIEVEAKRDAYELPLGRKALDLDMPVFGICRGFQTLNVLCGGGLIPDLRTGIRHRSYSRKVSASHLLRVVPGSRIEGWIGKGYAPTNSRHHQGVDAKTVAPGLEIAALAHDGIAEALEDPKRSWRFAVQWHPERKEERTLYERDRILFRAFVRECERR